MFYVVQVVNSLAGNIDEFETHDAAKEFVLTVLAGLVNEVTPEMREELDNDDSVLYADGCSICICITN